MSGKRCGDSDEVCQERAATAAETIVDKFLKNNASKKVPLPDEMAQKFMDLGDDAGSVSLFDEAVPILEADLAKLLQSI